mmetsp:Transcript_161011/g.283757  ORF Transcript_161011/g.283757 Transcript_161011/m.283757 type:complete len:329 (+) Transcript_161011:28-1014(+)
MDADLEARMEARFKNLEDQVTEVAGLRKHLSTLVTQVISMRKHIDELQPSKSPKGTAKNLPVDTLVKKHDEDITSLKNEISMLSDRTESLMSGFRRINDASQNAASFLQSAGVLQGEGDRPLGLPSSTDGAVLLQVQPSSTPAMEPQRELLFDCSSGASLGIEVNGSNGKALVIERIYDGLVKSWNEGNRGSEVKVGDQIVQVNDVEGTSLRLLSEVHSQSLLKLIVTRSLVTEDLQPIVLDRTDGATIGIEVDGTNGQTLVVKEVRGGLIQAWNDANPSNRLKVGDHVVKINNVIGSSWPMLTEIRSRKVLKLYVRPHVNLEPETQI